LMNSSAKCEKLLQNSEKRIAELDCYQPFSCS
jgi:hypothetical protein